MSSATEQRLNEQLDAAQRAESCLVPANRNDCRALDRRRSGLVEPMHGMFYRLGEWQALNPAERALRVMRGTCALHPNWTFRGTSAALAYGLPVSWRLLKTLHVTTPTSRAQTPNESSGLIPVVHHRSDSENAGLFNGVRVTSFARTVFDCLAELRPPDALAIADAALRLMQLGTDQLTALLADAYHGHRGIRRALDIVRLADGRAESGGESIARATMLELGYTAPELQVWVDDPLEAGKRYRVDFAWSGCAGAFVFGELDGRAKSEDPTLAQGLSKEEVLQRERLRESRLTYYGARIMRFTYADVLNRARFAHLLDVFGVPRRTQQAIPRPPLWRARHSELLAWDVGTILVSRTTLPPRTINPRPND